MPTSVHLPEDLLRAIDERAATRKVSRNRFIVECLRKTLAAEEEWSPEFLRNLDAWQATEPALEVAVDEMMAAIERGRSSKKAPPL